MLLQRRPLPAESAGLRPGRERRRRMKEIGKGGRGLSCIEGIKFNLNLNLIWRRSVYYLGHCIEYCATMRLFFYSRCRLNCSICVLTRAGKFAEGHGVEFRIDC
nr:hypothetical protein Itr_chr05CG04000 [Ipomoea trifida]